jgi:hypothetical protein
MRIARAVAAASLVVCSASVANAQEYNLVLKTGAGYTDNVRRVATDQETAGAAIVGVEFTAQRDRGRLTLQGLADLSYLWFFGTDAADDEIIGDANFRATYQIVQDRFSWTATESYSRLREDFLAPISPNNSQGFNQFTTGPNLTLPLSASLDFEAEARYSRSDYESSQEFDSERYLGGIGLTRRLSARSQIGIRASTEKFEAVDDSVILENPDFDRREYTIEFLTQSNRTDLTLEAGLTEVEGAIVDESGPLVRVLLQRRLTPTFTLQLDAGRQFSTTGERARRFRIDEAPTSDFDLLLPAAEPFEETRYGVTLTYRRPRTLVSVGAAQVREDYSVSTAVNRRLQDYRLVFQRRMTPQLDLTLQAGQTSDKLRAQPYNVDDRFIGATLRWRFTRAVSLALAAEDRKRDGSFNGFDYNERSARLLLRYSPWTPDVATTEAVEGPMR